MSESANRHEKAGTPDHGPTEAPPNLPRGWIAQWDAKAGKYYFVQLSTSHAQWELPTEPAPGVDTPSGTPMSGANSQFPRPINSPDHSKNNPETSRGIGSDENVEGERGFGSMAVNLLAGKQGHGNNHQGGLSGLAQSFLSSQSSHGPSHGSNGGGAGSIAASLISSALGGNQKPHNQTSSGHQSSTSFSGSGTPQSSNHSSGAGGLLGNLLGGHGSHSQNQQYGYSSGSSPAGGYSGVAPPAQYQPASQQHQQHQQPPQQHYASHNAPYNASGYSNQFDQQGQGAPNHNPTQYSGQQQGHHYGGIQRPDDPSKPFYVGGTPFDDHNSGYGEISQAQGPAGSYSAGQHGAYTQNQYGATNQPYGGRPNGGYEGHASSGRPNQFGQGGQYGNQGQHYPPSSAGSYGGPPGGSYSGPPRY